MTGQADLSAPRRIKLRAFVLVALLHGLAVVVLVRAFAPELARHTVDRVLATFAVPPPAPPAPTPPPPPSPPQRASAAARDAGAAGAAGRRAVPREVVAPAPRIVIATPAAPPLAGHGPADSAGARDTGNGAGGAGAGSGPGSGGAGSGQGGGGGSKVVKIAGDIHSARDYPAATRDLRIGDYVIVAITVGPDGRPTACRVARASRDAEADAITCKLALARFRFRPATDAAGNPVTSTYGWKQRWFFGPGDQP